MNILIDIGHPAHVHLFKNFAKIMIDKGNSVLFTARDKEAILDLLESYKMDYRVLGRHRKKLLSKLLTLFSYNYKLLNICKDFRPDIFLSHGSIYAAHVSAILNKPHVSFEDTEHSIEQIILYRPFTDLILTSDVFERDLGKKQKRYSGFHELAYLHPKYYSPNYKIKEELGLDKNEKFVLFRFVSWEATHDFGHTGLSLIDKRKLIKIVSKYAKIFVSSETYLPHDLEPYRLTLPSEKIHDIMNAASLYIGEGATMASECSVLGTPSIYVNNLNLGYINEQIKYGLVFQTESIAEISRIAIKLLENPNLEAYYNDKRDKMISEKIDVTEYLCNSLVSFNRSNNL